MMIPENVQLFFSNAHGGFKILRRGVGIKIVWKKEGQIYSPCIICPLIIVFLDTECI